MSTRLLTRAQEGAVDFVEAELRKVSAMLTEASRILTGAQEVADYHRLTDAEVPVLRGQVDLGLCDVRLLGYLQAIDRARDERRRLPRAQMVQRIRDELDRASP